MACSRPGPPEPRGLMTPARHEHRRRLAVLLAVTALTGCHGSVGRPAAVDAGRVEVSPPSPAAAPPAQPTVALDAGVEVPAEPDAAPPPDGAPPADTGPPSTEPGEWARQVQLSLVEISQAVFIKLGDDKGAVPPAMRNSKLIAGRAAYVRAHVRTDPGFTARPLRAVLTLGQGD